MKIICVSSNPRALRDLMHQTQQVIPRAVVYGCQDPTEAEAMAKTEGCDVLMTDTDLHRLHSTGFMLAERIKKLNPRLNIIFVTDNVNNAEAYASFQIRASGYVERPLNPQRLAEEFANLRFSAV